MEMFEKEAAKYIRDNIELIKNKNFTELYKKCKNALSFIPAITNILLESGINPLLYMQSIPEEYAYRLRIDSVTIPSSITTVGEKAFWGCTNLHDIVIPDSTTSVRQFAFKQCNRLCVLTVKNPKTYFGKESIETYNLSDIDYNGTKYEFSQYFNMGALVAGWGPIKVNCTDGSIDVKYFTGVEEYRIV